jgi:DNA polymerase-3 subunit epsilon
MNYRLLRHEVSVRQIILDTETTGLDVAQGNRIIEIGCVEMVGRKLTGRHYHQYINPGRDIEPGAQAVHGISSEFLQDKPAFADVMEEFLAFIRGAEIIIHNAPFDTAFINSEVSRVNGEAFLISSLCRVTDSLVMARDRHPGQRNNLDALCKRYAVHNTQRTLHGALLDAEILADVYLAMTGGQVSLALGAQGNGDVTAGNYNVDRSRRVADPTVVARLQHVQPSPEELQAHHERMAVIAKKAAGNCHWQV